MQKLGILQLVHARPQFLLPIWKQIGRFAGINVHLQIALSNPTTQVVEEVARLQDLGLPLAHHTIQVVEVPFGPCDPGYAERFFELRTWQIEQLPDDCTYGVLQDDDHLLEDEAEFVKLIKEGAADLIYGTRLYFWDSPTTYTSHIPTHRSLFAWRHYPGDRIPSKFEGKPGPEIAHERAKKIVDLKGKLLDYGYLSEEDRARVWQDYKRVGKLDHYTLALVRKPQLHPWKGVTFV